MSLLNGTLSLRRFTTSSDLPDNYNAVYTNQIDENALREPKQPILGQVFGWCHPDDLFKLDHPSADWIVGPYGRLCLRIDTRKVPTARVRAEVNTRVKTWREENKQVPCPSSMRAEFKEQIVDELLQKMIPKTKLVFAIWDLYEGQIVIDSVSEKTVETFCALFRQTFGLDLVVTNPNSALSREELVALVGTMETSLRDDPEWSSPNVGQLSLPDDACTPRFTLPSDLLLWMGLRSQQDSQWVENTFADFTFWIDDRVVLDDTSGKVVITGDSAGESPELMTALLAGKTPTEIRFGFHIEEHEYIVTLRGENLDWISAKMPKSEAKDDEERLYERVLFFDKLHNAIVEVFKVFARVRGSAEWVQWIRETQVWVQSMHALGNKKDR